MKNYFKYAALNVGLVNVVRLFLVLLWTDFIFRILSLGSYSGLLRSFFLMVSTALLFGSLYGLLSRKLNNILMEITCWFFPTYAFLQCQFKNFMSAYVSIKQAFEATGPTRILQFISPFISSIRLSYILFFALPGILCYVYYKKLNYKTNTNIERKITLVFLLLGIISECLCDIAIIKSDIGELYRNPTMIDRSLNEFGVNRFFALDLFSFGAREEVVVNVPTVSLPTTTPTSETDGVASSRSDALNSDTSWYELYEKETDENLKTIDAYLLNQKISDFNEYTGVFKDYNVIYVMIEAFDYMAIDKDLTPTLYKMKEEGWDFTNHYTPIYSCATGESEFVSQLSLYPRSDVCSINAYSANTWTNSIFSLFKNAGYYTSAFHNWKDEFYDREEMYANSGCELYMNHDDLDFSLVAGWPSDWELFDITNSYYVNQEKFFTFYVTSTTHFPYDEYSTWGDYFLDEIDKVHPEYPSSVKRYLSKAMNLDRGFESLLNTLEEKGIAENTVIVMFGDHHPLNMAYEYFYRYGSSQVNRDDDFDIDRTPFIIYSPKLTGTKFNEVNCTADIVPTVANLFGLSFEPRLYLGTDYFSDNEHLAVFASGSFVDNTGGRYSASDGSYEGGTKTEAEIETIVQKITDSYNISRMIYSSNYFKYRPSLPLPTYTSPINLDPAISFYAN